MKYATVIITLAILNVLVMYSGLPMGWKKAIVVVCSIILLFIGWVLRAAYRRKQQRALARAREMENDMGDELQQVADVIAHDVRDRVEDEIDVIQGQK